MASLRDIRKRIRSIKSQQKITRAMKFGFPPRSCAVMRSRRSWPRARTPKACAK